MTMPENFTPPNKIMANDDKAAKDRDLFNTIADHYSRKDRYPPSKIARKLRLTQTLKQIESGALPDVLEVGCGAGYTAEYVTGLVQSYTGIDYADELVKYAINLHQNENTHFECADLYAFQPIMQYDVILMIGVLHHMPDHQQAIAIAHSWLKPGGYLLINEPQAGNPIIGGLRWLRTKVDKNYSADQEELSATQLTHLFKQKFCAVHSAPQGIFSTPFAEVMLKPMFIMNYLSKASCFLDTILEKYLTGVLARLTWNIIVVGRKKV